MAWTAPASFSVGEIVTSTKLNTHLRDNLKAMAPIHYSEITASVTITGTTSGSPTVILSGAAVTYEARPILVEFFCPVLWRANGGRPYVGLYDGTTLVSTIGRLEFNTATGTPFLGRHRFTPTAASHTYNIRAWVPSGVADAIAYAGTGAAGADVPASLTIRYDEF